MSIEIRELIIEGQLKREEDKGEESTKILTTEDIEKIKDDVIESMRSSGGLTPEQKRAMTDDILQEVRRMMEDRWRR